MRFTTATAVSVLTAAIMLSGCRPPERAPDTATPSATAQATQATAIADAAATPATSTSGMTASGSASASGTATSAAAGTISITPTSFEMGDLFHVGTREGGENTDFGISGPPSNRLMEFLLAHRNQTIQVTVERAREGQTDEQDLPQQDLITGASINGQTAAQWWAALSPADQRRWGHEAECAHIPNGMAQASDNCPAQMPRP